MNNPTIDDGGPAFPFEDWDPAIHSQRIDTGMSLRDWFAGQALAGLCATLREGEVVDREGDFEKSLALSAKHFSIAAFAYADAMLAARKAKP